MIKVVLHILDAIWVGLGGLVVVAIIIWMVSAMIQFYADFFTSNFS